MGQLCLLLLLLPSPTLTSSSAPPNPELQVLEFPEDDIEVNLVPRRIRTEEHVVPEEPYAQVLYWKYLQSYCITSCDIM